MSQSHDVRGTPWRSAFGLATAWDPKWRYPEAGTTWWAMTPAMRAFYDYVGANYVPTGSIGTRRWVIYRRLANPEAR